MANNKSWRKLTSEVAETFRKWRVVEWALEPEKQPPLRNRYHLPDHQTVKIRWRKLGKQISLVCSSENTAPDNLQLLATTIETLRLNEVRKVDRLGAGAYSLMYPPPAPKTPVAPPPIDDTNPYAVLGVSPSYTLAIIEIIWKARLRAEHPDVGGDEERAKALNEAMDEIRRQRT